jgi:hypothetical protein
MQLMDLTPPADLFESSIVLGEDVAQTLKPKKKRSDKKSSFLQA